MDSAAAQNLVVRARAHHQSGRNTEALTIVTEALSGHPTAAAWNLRGDIHLALGDIVAAEQAYIEAVQREPDNAGYHHDRARALLAGRRMAEAEDVLMTAARLNGRAWDIMCDLGTAQLEQGKMQMALASFTAALALKPDAAAALFNRGSVLRDLGRLDEAEAAFVSAARSAPAFLPPMISLITLMGDLGRLPEAEKWFAEAVRIAPQEPQIHQARALALLRHGDLRGGSIAYEARFVPSRFALPVRPFTAPRWKGESLTGKSILIWTEQGIGDELLSAGMFTDVIAAAASCTIECSERAVPLFQRSFPKASIVARYDPPAPETQGSFDYQIPALSLCGLLRTDMTGFPRHRGYLRADPDLTQKLRRSYRNRNPGAIVVGIAWDSAGRHGANKRLPLEHWAPVLSQEDVVFVSLQYGAGPATPGLKGVILDETVDALKSLDAAAAQTAAMDMVITVSNTTAHLAGALNVPAWTLLPDGPGCLWYWFRERLDSPWYPSVRIFRQPRPGAWAPAVDEAARALVELKAKGPL
ncbi:MAG: tetratricopeptide repeat protein [Rhodospirillaceae bacterium]|nr:tetratricopeptide repeat protein [Rhodospirillaceae bacterium]